MKQILLTFCILLALFSATQSASVCKSHWLATNTNMTGADKGGSPIHRYVYDTTRAYNLYFKDGASLSFWETATGEVGYYQPCAAPQLCRATFGNAIFSESDCGGGVWHVDFQEERQSRLLDDISACEPICKDDNPGVYTTKGYNCQF